MDSELSSRRYRYSIHCTSTPAIMHSAVDSYQTSCTDILSADLRRYANHSSLRIKSEVKQFRAIVTMDVKLFLRLFDWVTQEGRQNLFLVLVIQQHVGSSRLNSRIIWYRTQPHRCSVLPFFFWIKHNLLECAIHAMERMFFVTQKENKVSLDATIAFAIQEIHDLCCKIRTDNAK